MNFPTHIKSQFGNTPERTKKYTSFFIWFYTIGLVGLLIPYTNSFFQKLTPLALLISTFAILAFHNYKPLLKTIIVFCVIFIAGYVVEVFGVNTGKVFGNYYYGKTLGLKIFSTPLIIGINWLLLIYSSASIMEKLKLNPFLSIFLASVIMLGYDIILEQTASRLDMWYWVKDFIPLRNFIAWFIIALVLHSFLKISGVKTENKIAPVIFLCQLAFFSCIFIVNSFIK